MSTITIITGPMFSGKTTELQRLFSREQIANRKSIFFKPIIDNRYSNKEVVNHNGQKVNAINISTSKDILLKVNEYLDSEEQKNEPLTNVFIDEVQFFDSDVIDIIHKIIDLDINVFCSGLNQTFEGKPFPFKDKKEHIGTLMALSDFIIHLNAVCNKCGGVATKTYRLGSNKETVVIGGIDKYQARCTKCFNEN